MSATPTLDRTHPVHRLMGRLHDVLDTIDSGSAWSLSTDELAESLPEAHAVQARLAEVTAALVRQAEAADLATHDGSANTAAWLRTHLNLSPTEARRQVAFAHALAGHEPTRAALAEGVVSAAHASVITAAVDALPRSVQPDLRSKAEGHLIAEA